MAVDITVPLRNALIANSDVTSLLPSYLGGFPIFTRRPVPDDVSYPCIVISKDLAISDQDGVNDLRPVIQRDISVYGLNEPASNYHALDTIAHVIRNMFQRQRNVLSLTSWSVTQIVATGPVDSPADSDKLAGRTVSLTIQLARKVDTFNPLLTDPFLFVLPQPGRMWQDAAKSIPVTKDGQPVRLLEGYGNTLTLNVSHDDARRPIYRTSGGLHWLDVNAEGALSQEQYLSCSGFGVPNPVDCMTAFRRDAGLGQTNSRIAGGPSHWGSLVVGSGNSGVALFQNVTSPTVPYTIGTDAVATYRFAPTGRLRIDDGDYTEYDNSGSAGVTTNFYNGLTIAANQSGIASWTRIRFYGHIAWANSPSDSVLALALSYMAALQGREL